MAAVTLLAPAIACASDISGAWKFETTGAKGRATTMTCTLAQSGAHIAGACVTPHGATVDVSGTVTGNQVDFGYNVTGSPFHVDFKACSSQADRSKGQ